MFDFPYKLLRYQSVKCHYHLVAVDLQIYQTVHRYENKQTEHRTFNALITLHGATKTFILINCFWQLEKLKIEKMDNIEVSIFIFQQSLTRFACTYPSLFLLVCIFPTWNHSDSLSQNWPTLIIIIAHMLEWNSCISKIFKLLHKGGQIIVYIILSFMNDSVCIYSF